MLFPDFGKLGEVVPKIEAFISQVIGIVSEIQREQAEQRALLESINKKLSAQEVNENE